MFGPDRIYLCVVRDFVKVSLFGVSFDVMRVGIESSGCCVPAPSGRSEPFGISCGENGDFRQIRGLASRVVARSVSLRRLRSDNSSQETLPRAPRRVSKVRDDLATFDSV
jgi:hypothetical protein